MTSIGTNIRRLRIKKGYKTQGAFAKALGVPQSRLSDWETDRYGSPAMPSIVKIASVLGVGIGEIIPMSKSDLPFHADQVHSAHVGHTRSTHPDEQDSSDTAHRLEHALKELHEAAGIFRELSELSNDWSARAKDWSQRLIALSIEPIASLPGRQTPVGRSKTPGLSKSDRGHHRQADRTRRKHSA
jgi:transcriptional regulator with XRE-family HTH domain